MNIYKVYFSPTGNTKKVLDAVAKPFGEAKEEFQISCPFGEWDDSIKYFNEEDLIIVAVPSYGGRMPELSARRLREFRSKLNENPAKAIIITSYGQRDFDDTLLEMKDILNEGNIKVLAAVTAVTEHSVSRKVAKGRPNACDIKELENFGKTIYESLENAKEEIDVPGKRPYKATKKFPFIPLANERCTGCGFCISRCPVEAIPSDAPYRTDSEKCISCMKCISICPENARELPSEMKNAVYTKITSNYPKPQKNHLYI